MSNSNTESVSLEQAIEFIDTTNATSTDRDKCICTLKALADIYSKLDYSNPLKHHGDYSILLRAAGCVLKFNQLVMPLLQHEPTLEYLLIIVGKISKRVLEPVTDNTAKISIATFDKAEEIANTLVSRWNSTNTIFANASDSLATTLANYIMNSYNLWLGTLKIYQETDMKKCIVDILTEVSDAEDTANVMLLDLTLNN